MDIMKREDNGKWVYGAFYPIKDEDVSFIINNCKSIDFDDDNTTFNGYKVHKKSVGQFTGLHDKNGEEIYECDVLNFGNNNPVEVKFENGAFTVFSEPLGWDFDSDDMPILTDFKYCEIIGNSFENPELLEKKFAN